MPQIEAGELSLHAQLLGRGGTPVVMLHGLLVGSVATWYFGVAPTVARDHRVVMYDLRGHGRSEKASTGYGLATLSDDLGAVIDSLDLPVPVDLVGHSYGALIATRWTLDHPGKVRRLALVDPPMPASAFESIDALAARSPDELAGMLPDVVQRGLEQGGRRSRRFLQGVGHLLGASSMVADVRAEPDFTDEALASIECPVLAVFGRHSPCVTVADRLAETISDLQVHRLDAGHFLPIEVPDELTAIIVEFLDG